MKNAARNKQNLSASKNVHQGNILDILPYKFNVSLTKTFNDVVVFLEGLNRFFPKTQVVENFLLKNTHDKNENNLINFKVLTFGVAVLSYRQASISR